MSETSFKYQSALDHYKQSSMYSYGEKRGVTLGDLCTLLQDLEMLELEAII